MTHDEIEQSLRRNFRAATAAGKKHPAKVGHTPRSYAVFVAGVIRKMVSEKQPTAITPIEAEQYAATLESGAMDHVLEELFQEGI